MTSSLKFLFNVKQMQNRIGGESEWVTLCVYSCYMKMLSLCSTHTHVRDNVRHLVNIAEHVTRKHIYHRVFLFESFSKAAGKVVCTSNNNKLEVKPAFKRTKQNIV